jgi:hypothetical protein
VRTTLFLTTGGSGATLDWGRAAGATAYNVYRGAAPGFMSGSPAPWMTLPQNTLVDGALPAPIFFYVVRATDGSAESAD